MTTHIIMYAVSESWDEECNEPSGRLISVLINGIVCLVYRHFDEDDEEEEQKKE